MGNKEWDNYLRDLLGKYKSEGTPSAWDDFAGKYESPADPSDLTDQFQDEELKETLSGYRPSGPTEGWDRLEASLEEADKTFDDQIRNKINDFRPPNDPHPWPLFLEQLSAHKLLRVKLITLKVIESAAILLLLITILHMGHLGKFNFISTAPNDLLLTDSEQPERQNLAEAQDQISSEYVNTLAFRQSQEDFTYAAESLTSAKEPNSNASILAETRQQPRVAFSALPQLPVSMNVSFTGIAENTLSPVTADMPTSEALSDASSAPEAIYPVNTDAQFQPATEKASFMGVQYVTQSLAALPNKLETRRTNTIPDPVFVSTASKKFLEFGMLAQVDYNQLKLPEDVLFSNGKQVVFPLLGITSPGYGAGFTLAIGHPRWAMETGIVYNAKNFKPGRELIVGEEADNSNVEFEAMHMQVISVPLQYRYRFDYEGRLKAYALAGFSLHYIVQSDIDVLIEHNFPSLSAGEDPTTVPALARTIRQAQRVSEDIKDSAPFSTRSYISANLGAGIEYAITEQKTLFFQTAYQYQIPNLRFSNHNGKHLLSVSFQAGVRTPLGS